MAARSAKGLVLKGSIDGRKASGSLTLTDGTVLDWSAALNKRQWLFSTASGLEAFVDRTSVGCRLSLAEIYDKVEFQPELG